MSNLQILTDAVSTRKGETLSGRFYIDSTIGSETSLTFSYSHYIVVRIEGPNENYTEENYKDSFKYDLSSKVLRVMIPGISQVSDLVHMLLH